MMSLLLFSSDFDILPVPCTLSHVLCAICKPSINASFHCQKWCTAALLDRTLQMSDDRACLSWLPYSSYGKLSEHEYHRNSLKGHVHTWQLRSCIQVSTSSARAASLVRMHAFSNVLKVTMVGCNPSATSSRYLQEKPSCSLATLTLPRSHMRERSR